jgi:hypothetical protein
MAFCFECFHGNHLCHGTGEAEVNGEGIGGVGRDGSCVGASLLRDAIFLGCRAFGEGHFRLDLTLQPRSPRRLMPSFRFGNCQY